MKNPLITVYILATSISFPGTMGGNTRIFIELTKRFESILNIHIITHDKGLETCKNYEIKDSKFHILHFTSKYLNTTGTNLISDFFCQFVKTIEASLVLLRVKELNVQEPVTIYSSTDFFPDVIPALILKLRLKNKITWIAGFWLFAPKPFNKKSLHKDDVRNLLFYIYQLPLYYFVKKFADIVFITSEPDIEKFVTKRRDRSKIIVIRGGIDTKLPQQVPTPMYKKYDGVFIGRFHQMKGVLELIDIWKYVTSKKKDAKLAMIGNGPLEKDIVEKIKEYELENNIIVFGFKDGVEKIKIFKLSKIAIHPSIYDSGGMAVCEAMICGLPAVSFDLEALKTYYPKGVIKTPCFDLEVFADNILRLIKDKELYDITAKDALEWAEEWDWDKKAEDILQQIQKLVHQQ